MPLGGRETRVAAENRNVEKTNKNQTHLYIFQPTTGKNGGNAVQCGAKGKKSAEKRTKLSVYDERSREKSTKVARISRLSRGSVQVRAKTQQGGLLRKRKKRISHVGGDAESPLLSPCLLYCIVFPIECGCDAYVVFADHHCSACGEVLAGPPPRATPADVGVVQAVGLAASL